MKRNRLIFGLVALLIVMPLAWWLGSPLFIDQTISESDPFTASEVSVSDNSAETLAIATFTDADNAHRGSGTATILQQGDRRVLRFTDFEVTNGPDLHVYLVKNIAGRSEQTFDGYIDLGSLKGNIGEQNYDLAADVDLSEYGGIIIYCQPFHVTLSIAEFAP
jgi:hypothetical protein